MVRAKDKIPKVVSIPSTTLRKFSKNKELRKFLAKGRIQRPQSKYAGWLFYKQHAIK